jgi:hypothetical protein
VVADTQVIVRLARADAFIASARVLKASKPPQLKELFLRQPLVSTRMIQKAPKESPEGATYLVGSHAV